MATVIVTLSALPDPQWKGLLDRAFADGLMSMTTFAIPYDDLIRHHDIGPIPTGRQLLPEGITVGPEPRRGLEFPQAPGPGYTPAHSYDEVRFKYDDLPRRMRPTLTALRQEPEFTATVAALRERGWRDWHILLAVHNVAKNARIATAPDTS